MAYKQFQLDELTVKIFKRRSSRSLRLSVTASGDIRVSIPTWTPYAAGMEFASNRKNWIKDQLKQQPTGILVEGQAIGKAHRLHFIASSATDKPTSRLKQNAVVISHPTKLDASHPDVQAAAIRGGIRALRNQAESLLPQRLQTLARQHGYVYRSVSIKQLKSRWGSCDSRQNITLNLFLMQLPWDCIDYVLLHELAHTKVLRHGPPFWQEMERALPAAKDIRRRIKAYQPILHTGLPLAVA